MLVLHHGCLLAWPAALQAALASWITGSRQGQLLAVVQPIRRRPVGTAFPAGYRRPAFL